MLNVKSYKEDERIFTKGRSNLLGLYRAIKSLCFY